MVLILVFLFLIVVGMFMDAIAAMFILIPVLLPPAVSLGVDPIHFAIIFTHNMEIGLVHPPVGLNLFVLSSIAAAPMGEVIRGILPFLLILLIVLAIIVCVPVLTLWLPDLVFGR
jgi:C4-dicarboxylate transporter DctM subunit